MPNKSSFLLALSCMLSSMNAPLSAGEVDVVDAKAQCSGSCRFDVTLLHADSGWDHYANRWEVLAPDGTVLGTRVLHHPHVREQPFTRSLGGISIPAEISEVRIRAYDSMHGNGGREITITLPR